MKKAIVYIAAFGLCLALVGLPAADDEEGFPVPVEFTSMEMQDIGNFHGSAPGNEQAGWHFWGGREPIVSPDWVIFPVTGAYRFVVECRSQQFTPDDKVFAEFDVRLHILGEKNIAGVKIKDLIENISDATDDPVFAHGSSTTDQRKGEDWAKITVTSSDPITGDPIEIEAGTKAQVEVWFTNDACVDPNDRNLFVRSVAVLLPEGVKISVEPISKLAVTWGGMKSETGWFE